MATDNTTLNPGAGGDVSRTLADSSGAKWQAVAASYATTISPGANVLQVVDADHGMPITPATGATFTIVQSDASAVKATVAIADGQTIAVTQSGSWDVAVTGTPTVQIAADQTIGITGTPSVSQSGAWTFGLSAGQTLASVTNVGTLGTITNPVGLAAGSNLVGKASVGADTSAIYSGTVALTPQFARFSSSSSGKTVIVPAPGPGKQVRVLRWNASANGDVAVTLYSSTTTAISGTKYLTQFGSAGGAFCPVGICQTAANEALEIDLSAAVAVSGEVTYIVVG